MTRYYELNVDPKFTAEADFVYRKRDSHIASTIGWFTLGAVVLLLIHIYAPSIGGTWISGILMAAVICALGAYTVVIVQRHLDLVTSIEFQNALFSSAFTEGSVFAMIVSEDDNMYYADPSFYRLFAHLAKSRSQILDRIVQQSHNPQYNLDKLNHAMLERVYETMDIMLEIDGEMRAAIMTIIPISRPSGYFFISAKYT